MAQGIVYASLVTLTKGSSGITAIPDSMTLLHLYERNRTPTVCYISEVRSMGTRTNLV